MRKNILGWVAGSVIVVGAFLLLNGMFSTFEMLVYPDYATAATSSVTVSASITAVISCSTNTGSTDFGTWTDTSIKTATPNASTTMSCVNSGAGCTLYVKDLGDSSNNPGLWNSTSSKLIASASTTLADGTEGYGLQATSTAIGNGDTLDFSATYNKTGDVVGGLLTNNATLASTNATSSNREAVVTHKAAIANSTPSGSYADTITYECTAN